MLLVLPALALSPQSGSPKPRAAAAAAANPARGNLDAALANWSVDQRRRDATASRLRREVHRISLADVPLWLCFEGRCQPVVLAGTATTDDLHALAARLHDLQSTQLLRLSLHGAALPPGTSLIDTPLAQSAHLRVQVAACEWPIRRGFANPCSSASATAASGVAATTLARRGAPPPTRKLRCHGHDAGAVQAAFDSQLHVMFARTLTAEATAAEQGDDRARLKASFRKQRARAGLRHPPAPGERFERREGRPKDAAGRAAARGAAVARRAAAPAPLDRFVEGREEGDGWVG